MSGDIKLLPCEHCQAPAFLERNEVVIEELGIIQAGCTKCGALGPFVDADDPDAFEKAAGLWNTRTASTREKDLEAALRRIASVEGDPISQDIARQVLHKRDGAE